MTMAASISFANTYGRWHGRREGVPVERYSAPTPHGQLPVVPRIQTCATLSFTSTS